MKKRTVTSKVSDMDIDKIIDEFSALVNDTGKSDDGEEKLQNSERVVCPSQDIINDGISGKHIFGFQTPKSTSRLKKLVNDAKNTPIRVQDVGESSRKKGKSVTLPHKTPRRVRKVVMKGIDEIMSDNSNGGDFSPSESEYIPSSEDSSEENIDSELSNEKESDSEKSSSSSDFIKKPIKNIQYKNHSKSSPNHKDYVLKPDNYFSAVNNKTSNNTLKAISKLSDITISNYFASGDSEQNKEHTKCKKKLLSTKCKDFDKWIMLLHEGFNILLYGLGSKRKVLNLFQTKIENDAVIVVNGFFPSLTIKDILDGIIVDLLEEKNIPNTSDAVTYIKKRFHTLKNSILYLIVHNIDGPMLRNEKTQCILSTLATIPNIRIIASIDHINTPLIWNDAIFSNYNFIWIDSTTFSLYTEETSFENSMLVQKSGALALSSLMNVYCSLTKNSKGIFMLLCDYQLKNSSVKYYQGMPFRLLYSQCRENFLVSSDLALRAQLTEFLDHKLVKNKRSPDGTETLTVPIQNSILLKFKEKALNVQ